MATSLTGANQTTEWFDLRGSVEYVCFSLTGDFSTAVGLQYSNVTAYAKGTAFNEDDATYSTAIGPLKLPARIAGFVRFFSSASWSAGTTCTPSFAPAVNAEGRLFSIAPQEGN